MSNHQNFLKQAVILGCTLFGMQTFAADYTYSARVKQAIDKTAMCEAKNLGVFLEPINYYSNRNQGNFDSGAGRLYLSTRSDSEEKSTQAIPLKGDFYLIDAGTWNQVSRFPVQYNFTPTPVNRSGFGVSLYCGLEQITQSHTVYVERMNYSPCPESDKIAQNAECALSYVFNKDSWIEVEIARTRK